MCGSVLVASGMFHTEGAGTAGWLGQYALQGGIAVGPKGGKDGQTRSSAHSARYLPMQKLLKITPSKSSEVNSLAMAPRWMSAKSRSSASKSSAGASL